MKSLGIDIEIPGVGRIKKRTGVSSKRERDALVAMLHELPKRGHLQVVRDIRSGRYSLLAVYAHYVADTLAQLYGPTNEQPLAAVLDEWLEGARVAAGTRKNRKNAFKALRTDGRRTYVFRDLPDLLKAYRVECEQAGHARTFNIARTAVQAFLRDQSADDALVRDVARVKVLRERPRSREGFTVAEAVAIREKLGQEAGSIWWSMCLTGMGPKELWEDGFQVRNDRVHVGGQKTLGRDRDVPLVDATYPQPPKLTRDGFISALRRYKDKYEQKVTPYQARKTYARMMEDAGIPRTHRKLYMGHKAKDITDLYERHEITAFLKDDAKKLAGLLPEPFALRVVA